MNFYGQRSFAPVKTVYFNEFLANVKSYRLNLPTLVDLMKFNRLLIARFLAVTMVALLVYSFSAPSVLQKEFEFEKETVKAQLQENFDDPENNLIRSGIEALNVVFKLSSDYNFVSFENFYTAVVQIHLAQIIADENRLRSSNKLYLQFASLLI
jgi:hypothetical protein